MKIYRSIEAYRSEKLACSTPAVPAAVTLGKFDGVHRGHQLLIRRILKKAKEENLRSVVFAIDVSPQEILSHQEREQFLASMGADELVECPFSVEFMAMEPQRFISEIIRDTLHAAFLAVGTDFRFGHNRLGDAALLEALGRDNGYKLEIVEKERYLGEEISSTRVRGALESADMKLVKELLGREYPILGTICRGNHIGTGMGLPTVNLIPPPDKILPPDGVYVSLTRLEDGRLIEGITNIGFKPTVDGTFRGVETNLFDFSQTLYGSEVEVQLLDYLRPEKKFPGLEELKEQVQLDIATARDVLHKRRQGVRFACNQP